MATVTRSSIIKVVGEAPIVIEAIVGELGGGQGGAQGEKQNSLRESIQMREFFSLRNENLFVVPRGNICNHPPVALQMMAWTGRRG